MATLTGQSIASSYEQLLHVDTDGGGNTTTLVPVKDGDNGTTFAAQLSTTTICIDNPTASSATQGGILQLQSDDNAALASGHRLGAIQFYGSEASGGVVDTNVVLGAKIEAFADTGWGASENGADLVFTTVDGTTATEAMRITASGGVHEKGGVLKENLLTNSGFDVWSNSTLEDVTAVWVDDMADDGTGDWTNEGDALAFDTDHYEVSTSGINQQTFKSGRTFTVGKLYQVSMQVKNGSASGKTLQLMSYDGTSTFLSPTITTTGSFVTHTFVFEAGATTSSGQTGWKNLEDLSTNNIEVKDFQCYEVTPGCVTSNALAMDTWYKDSNLDIWRQHWDGTGSDSDVTKAGSFYSLKVTSATTDKYLGFPDITMRGEDYWLKKVAGRTMTFGCWLKTSTANCGYLRIYDTVTGWTDSSKHTGGDNWEWLEVTATINAGSTETTVNPAINVAGTVYFSQPMLVFGSSIGEGNYTRPQGEVVWMETPHRCVNDESELAADDKILNLEALSEGAVPKGAKAVQVRSMIKNTSITSGQGILYQQDSGTTYQLDNYPPVDNVFNMALGWVTCDSNGDIYQLVNEAGDTLVNHHLDICAVQLR